MVCPRAHTQTAQQTGLRSTLYGALSFSQTHTRTHAYTYTLPRTHTHTLTFFPHTGAVLRRVSEGGLRRGCGPPQPSGCAAQLPAPAPAGKRAHMHAPWAHGCAPPRTVPPSTPARTHSCAHTRLHAHTPAHTHHAAAIAMRQRQPCNCGHAALFLTPAPPLPVPPAPHSGGPGGAGSWAAPLLPRQVQHDEGGWRETVFSLCRHHVGWWWQGGQHAGLVLGKMLKEGQCSAEVVFVVHRCLTSFLCCMCHFPVLPPCETHWLRPCVL